MSTAAAAGRNGSSARGEIRFEVVHAAVGAVAAGELAGAFATLLDELAPWGLQRGGLFAYENGDLHRIAGDHVDPATCRRLSLYDGQDVVGEIRLELKGTPPVELLELMQDVLGLGLGRQTRTHELDLVRAAVAVNGADTLDDALTVIAETCARVSRAPFASVTVWEPALTRGTLRGAAGDALAVAGETIEPGTSLAYQAVTTGRPAIATNDRRPTGVSPRLAAQVPHYACALAVPLLVEGAPPLAFQLGWREAPSTAGLETAIATVRKLGALTAVAFRAAEERAHVEHQEHLRRVIEAVPEGSGCSRARPRS